MYLNIFSRYLEPSMCCTTIILELRWLRMEDHNVKTQLGLTVRRESKCVNSKGLTEKGMLVIQLNYRMKNA